MPPVWKIRRELLRIWGQVRYLTVRLSEGLYLSLLALVRRAEFKTHEGQQAHHDKSAIFLIYQPDGLLQSTLETCRHLDRHGYAITLVTNAPLADAETAQILPLCRRIIERPNIGYDFGGYKQAVLSLLATGDATSRLLLLNDSIWFPLRQDCTLLRQVEALQTDLAGPVYYSHAKPKNTHLQSYMILFSQKAVRHPAFRRFWKNYIMSNDRNRTIRHGEKALTYACASAGLSVGYLHDAFEKPSLDGLSPDEAAEVAAYDAWRWQEIQARRKPELSPDANIRLSILTNHPMVNLKLLGFHLLKKGRDLPYQQQRAALTNRLDGEFSPIIRAEVRAHDA